MLGKMSRRSLAKVVLPLEEHPLIPITTARSLPILDRLHLSLHYQEVGVMVGSQSVKRAVAPWRQLDIYNAKFPFICESLIKHTVL